MTGNRFSERRPSISLRCRDAPKLSTGSNTCYLDIIAFVASQLGISLMLMRNGVNADQWPTPPMVGILPRCGSRVGGLRVRRSALFVGGAQQSQCEGAIDLACAVKRQRADDLDVARMRIERSA